MCSVAKKKKKKMEMWVHTKHGPGAWCTLVRGWLHLSGLPPPQPWLCQTQMGNWELEEELE